MALLACYVLDAVEQRHDGALTTALVVRRVNAPEARRAQNGAIYANMMSCGHLRPLQMHFLFSASRSAPT